MKHPNDTPLPRGIRTRQQRLWEIEKGIVVTVIGPGDKGPCDRCGGRRRLYYTHCFRQKGRPVKGLCKPCVVLEAGSEEKVWFRTTSQARKIWLNEGA